MSDASAPDRWSRGGPAAGHETGTAAAHASGDGGRPLAGLTVALTRAPDRTGALGDGLRAAGAAVLAVPVIDFARPEDPAALDAALAELAAGRYGWLAVTSATTVAALAAGAADRATSLPALLSAALPAAAGHRVRVAAVGRATADALTAAGLRVDLVPDGPSSAESLAAAWPDPGPGERPVLLPHSDLAAGTLEHRLTERGWVVRPVTAYRTVDFPADPGEALTPDAAPVTGTPAGPPAVPVADAQARRPDAVVVTSPSTLRRWLAAGDPCPIVAIGRTTAAAADDAGSPAGAVAATTDPDDVVRAVVEATGRAVDGCHAPPG